MVGDIIAESVGEIIPEWLGDIPRNQQLEKSYIFYTLFTIDNFK